MQKLNHQCQRTTDLKKPDRHKCCTLNFKSRRGCENGGHVLHYIPVQTQLNTCHKRACKGYFGTGSQNTNDTRHLTPSHPHRIPPENHAIGHFQPRDPEGHIPLEHEIVDQNKGPLLNLFPLEDILIRTIKTVYLRIPRTHSFFFFGSRK